MTTKVLNRRQARWAQELAGMDFNIYYRKGQVMASQMHYRGARSTALKRGEVKTG
jgi:hypothetical protein